MNDHSPVSDDPVAVLLLAVARQDRTALRHLYSDTSAKLLGVLSRHLGTRAEAEDALQEVYIRVWLKAGGYDARKGRGMTWLISLARHHAIDQLRRRPACLIDSDEIEDIADTAMNAEGRLVHKSDTHRIAKCLACLEPNRAGMLCGAYLDGNSYLDLAQRHDMPLNTVRTHLRRSILKLRVCMDA
ncbi:MAG: sigma-70 family RNA polymerase sigma factor [Candidatus Saccharibacteria bacterium]|nr:sigma-70 family RNA polymerase sigma factor [Pseudorhodobacter sp.]